MEQWRTHEASVMPHTATLLPTPPPMSQTHVACWLYPVTSSLAAHTLPCMPRPLVDVVEHSAPIAFVSSRHTR